MLHSFSCPRTCPSFERAQGGRFFCRFGPILNTLGPAVVTSHTVTVKVEYRDPETLRAAVLAMGGIWYGWADTHSLGDTVQSGWGFRLPMANGYHEHEGKHYWYHPLVLRPDGELAFDAYGGYWGDQSQLPLLKEEYTIQHTLRQAELLGWQAERTPQGITVYHPDGGVLTLSKEGVCETTGFVGAGCHEARLSLGLAAFGEIHNKAEFAQTKAVCRTGN